MAIIKKIILKINYQTNPFQFIYLLGDVDPFWEFVFVTEWIMSGEGCELLDPVTLSRLSTAYSPPFLH